MVYGNFKTKHGGSRPLPRVYPHYLLRWGTAASTILLAWATGMCASPSTDGRSETRPAQGTTQPIARQQTCLLAVRGIVDRELSLQSPTAQWITRLSRLESNQLNALALNTSSSLATSQPATAPASLPASISQLLELYPNTHLYTDADGSLELLVPTKNQDKAAIASAVVGGSANAVRYTLCSNPHLVQSWVTTACQQNLAGLILDDASAWPDLTLAGLGYYSTVQTPHFNPAIWSEWLSQRFGVKAEASQLLEAIQHASAILPTFGQLTGFPCDKYMPQFALPLAYYLALPTTSMRPEHRQTETSLPNLFASPLAEYPQQPSTTMPTGQHTPLDIARIIEEHTRACRSLLTTLRYAKLPPQYDPQPLKELLDRIEFNTAIGEHLLHRIRAASEFERFRIQRSNPDRVTRELQEAITAWSDVGRLGQTLYPQGVPYWRSELVSPKPWTSDMLKASFVAQTGHWKDQEWWLRREMARIQQRLYSREPLLALPLWDEIVALFGDSLHSLNRIGFELKWDQRFRLHAGASLTQAPDEVLVDRVSVLADTTSMDAGWHEVLTTDIMEVPLLKGRPHQISFRYQVLQGNGRIEMEAGIRPVTGGEHVGQYRFWSAASPTAGIRFLQIPELPNDNYTIFIAVHGSARVVFDNLELATSPEY